MKFRQLLAASLICYATAPHAEITRHAGSNEALPEKKYVHVVSEADSPVSVSATRKISSG